VSTAKTITKQIASTDCSENIASTMTSITKNPKSSKNIHKKCLFTDIILENHKNINIIFIQEPL